MPFPMPSRAEPEASIVIPGVSRGRIDCHPERRAQPVAEGSAGHSRQISPLPPEDPLARLLSLVPPKPLPPRTLQPFFRARWTSRLTTSHGSTAFSGAEGLNAGQPRTVLPDACARDAISDAILWHPPISFPNGIPSGTGGFDCHPGCKQGPPRLSSRAEGTARSRGICRVTPSFIPLAQTRNRVMHLLPNS